MHKYTRFSARAGLGLVGLYLQQEQMWAEIEQRVHIPQKTVKHSPSEKLLDALIHILAGGAGLNELNRRVHPDVGLQRAFGRRACAEQSTISQTLNACGDEQVAQMKTALSRLFRRYSQAYRHDYQLQMQVLDIDFTGLLAGKTAEGATRGYFAGQRHARGRQLGRVIASIYEEIVVERLYNGKKQLEKSLAELVREAEGVLQLSARQRQHTLVRIDGGGGTDEQLNQLLGRADQILAKVKNYQRTQKLVRSVQAWQADPKVAGRELGWVTALHPYVRPTRQLAVRWWEQDKWRYRVLVTTCSDSMLQELIPAGAARPADSLQLIAWAYDQRSGGIETNFKGSKSGLGLVKRNKRRFAAQHMLVLLAQLAHNLILWTRRLAPQLSAFGMLRMVRDVFHIPGKITFTASGQVLQVRLQREHDLAQGWVLALQAILPRSKLRLCLGKI